VEVCPPIYLDVQIMRNFCVLVFRQFLNRSMLSYLIPNFNFMGLETRAQLFSSRAFFTADQIQISLNPLAFLDLYDLYPTNNKN
jgi:hypothetical protein